MKIKRSTAALLALLVLLFSLVSCEEDTPSTPETVYYTVSFDYNNGDGINTVKVSEGSHLTEPIAPEREGYIFDGWKNGAYNWHFEHDTVKKDVTLVATWIDAASIFDYSPNDDGTVTVTGYTGALSALRIPSIISGKKVSAVADELFSSLILDKLNEIVLPDTVTKIGTRSFAECSEVKIIIKGAVTELGESAFEGCDGVSEIPLGEGLEVIPFNAFASCTKISAITVPASTKLIEENAFYKCSSLQVLVINSKDLTIENSAFSDCEALKTVFFIGNAEEWDALVERVDNGGRENSAFLDADVYFYSEDKPLEDGNYWYMNDNGEPRCW